MIRVRGVALHGLRKFLGLLLCVVCISAQGIGQTIKGRVLLKESKTQAPLALISVSQDSIAVIQTESDSLGYYELHLQKAGKYDISYYYEAYSGYMTLDLPEDAILNVDVFLDQEVQALAHVTIHEDAYRMGDLTMTQRQFKTMPASFQDPSRIIIRYPSFSTANDGANSIVYRGMPPEAARWQLFGADIVNPNHLSNAGTANDLATNYAGGVNALNGAVLDYYHFEASPANVSYGNIMSGVSDMKMASSMHSYLDLNLIGLEGGLGTNIRGKNVYASYRYSFTGLLNQLGIDFGNEKIGYQDLSAFGELLKTEKVHLKVFATLGASHNYFAGIDSTDQPERFKDLQHITYKSQLGIVGSQFIWQKNHIFSYKATLIASSRQDNREEYTLDYFKQNTNFDHADDQEIKKGLWSFHNQFKWDFPTFKWSAGLRANYHIDENRINGALIEQSYFSLYPYVQLENSPLNKWHYVLGIGTMYDDLTQEFTIEPAVALDWKLSNKVSIGLSSRLSSLQDYTDLRYILGPYQSLRIKSGHVQLSGKYEADHRSIGGNLFYSHLWDVAKFVYEGQSKSYSSAFNGSNLGYDQLLCPMWIPDGTGTASTKGLEFYHFRTYPYSNHNWTIGYNLSIFSATYRNREAQRITGDYDGRYNYKTIANLSASYERYLSKTEKVQKLILSAAIHNRGGQFEPWINKRATSLDQLYDFDRSLSIKNKDYARLDFRIVYDRKKVTSRLRHVWSLDIQNVNNNNTIMYRSYDFLKQDLIYYPQLEILPVLSYRLIWE